MNILSISPFQHLGFVHCPIREHCPAFPHCTDAIVERTVSKRASRPASLLGDNNHLNLILLGQSVFLQSSQSIAFNKTFPEFCKVNGAAGI